MTQHIHTNFSDEDATIPFIVAPLYKARFKRFYRYRDGKTETTFKDEYVLAVDLVSAVEMAQREVDDYVESENPQVTLNMEIIAVELIGRSVMMDDTVAGIVRDDILQPKSKGLVNE